MLFFHIFLLKNKQIFSEKLNCVPKILKKLNYVNKVPKIIF